MPRLAVIAAFLVTVALMPFPAISADASGPGVVRSTLANGLRVVIVRNTLAPVVATSVSYLVGADETPEGFPGMAHAQEHMMFRGNPGLPADVLAEIGSVMGGNFNAVTQQNATQYSFTVPAEDLEVALRIEALRMADVTDAEADWAQERGAIEQEVAQDLSSPQYVLFTRLREALFAGTPYAHDALGTKDSFDRTTGAMLKEFHDRWYAPNNAVLVVAGDLDPAATLAKIQELFGPLAAKKLPPRPAITLGPVTPTSLDLPSDLPYGLAVLALRLPGTGSPDWAATEVLTSVLNSQRGALYGLVPEGKALDAGFAVDPLAKAGLGYAMMAYPEGADPKTLLAESRAILARIAHDGVPAELVEAAKHQERRAAAFQKNAIADLADVWAEAVAVEGLDSPEQDLERIEKVTVADVNRVAAQVLDLDHVVTAVLTPRHAGQPAAGKGFGGQEKFDLGQPGSVVLPDWAARALGHLAVSPSLVAPVVERLPNGLTLIVQPEDVSDTVSVYGSIRNRPELQVPKGKEGLSAVVEELYGYGSQSLDRLAYQTALDEIGADEHAGSDFSVRVLADDFERGVALLADNQLHPAFPEAAFTVVRQQIADSVAGRIKSPNYQAGRALRKALFPAGDPTLRQAMPQTVAAVTLADVQSYVTRAFRPDLAVVVVVGKVTPERAKAVIAKYFGTWRATGPKPVTVLPRVPNNRAAATVVPDDSRVQAGVVLAESLGLDRSSPDYYALQLGNAVLGGSFYATRLSRDLRKTAGLVYDVSSYFDLGQSRGLYFVQYACDPGNVSKAHDIIVRELEAMRTTPVSQDELTSAKAHTLRRMALEEADVPAIAHGLIERWRLGLPLDEPTRAARRTLELDAGAIQSAFGKWVRPKDLVRISQGPEPK